MIFRLTPLTSATTSNEKLVNQKLCNTVLTWMPLIIYVKNIFSMVNGKSTRFVSFIIDYLYVLEISTQLGLDPIVVADVMIISKLLGSIVSQL